MRTKKIRRKMKKGKKRGKKKKGLNAMLMETEAQKEFNKAKVEVRETRKSIGGGWTNMCH